MYSTVKFNNDDDLVPNPQNTIMLLKSIFYRYIDYVNVMAYDYHMYQAYLPLTGANSPLYVRQEEKGYFTTLNVNWTASYWLFKGMPASKIIIGIPTYGHSFM